MKVMIVDDEQHMTEYLKHIIDWQQYGFSQVVTVNKGKQALQLLAEETPQLLIADIRMPEVSGLDLAERVSELDLTTKVIIVSGFSEFEYAQKAIRYGVTEYLVKPVLKKDFVAALEKVLPLLTEEKTAAVDQAASVAAAIPSPLQTPADKTAQADAITFLQEYIREHYDEPLSLELLAEKVHLNASYLSYAFKSATGENLLGYLTDVRMRKAAELLATSDLRVNSIGDMVGYHKTQYFISLFKKKYGLTPQQYRKQQH